MENSPPLTVEQLSELAGGLLALLDRFVGDREMTAKIACRFLAVKEKPIPGVTMPVLADGTNWKVLDDVFKANWKVARANALEELKQRKRKNKNAKIALEDIIPDEWKFNVGENANSEHNDEMTAMVAKIDSDIGDGLSLSKKKAYVVGLAVQCVDNLMKARSGNDELIEMTFNNWNDDIVAGYGFEGDQPTDN